MLAPGQRTIVGSVQCPDVPLRQLVRFSLGAVDAIRFASPIRVNWSECWKPRKQGKHSRIIASIHPASPLDGVVHAALVSPLPPLQAQLVPVLLHSAALRVAALH